MAETALLEQLDVLREQIQGVGGRIHLEFVALDEGARDLGMGLQSTLPEDSFHLTAEDSQCRSWTAPSDNIFNLLEKSDAFIAILPTEENALADKLAALAETLERPWIRMLPDDPKPIECELCIESAFHRDGMCSWLEEQGIIALEPKSISPDGMALEAISEKVCTLALQDATLFRDAAVWTLTLGASAALLAATVMMLPNSEPWHDYLAVALGLVQLILVFCVIGWKLRSETRHYRDIWSEARYARQVFKSAEASQPLLDPLDPILARKRPEWRRFAISVSLMLHHQKSGSFDKETFRDDYLEKRVRNQLTYFEKQVGKSRKFTIHGGRIALGCLLLSPIFAALAFLDHALSWDLSSGGVAGTILVGLFPILLPLGAAFLTSISRLLDHDRRTLRYADMVTRLQRRIEEAPHIHSESQLRMWVSRTEDLFADETLEWYFATSIIDLW